MKTVRTKPQVYRAFAPDETLPPDTVVPPEVTDEMMETGWLLLADNENAVVGWSSQLEEFEVVE